MECTHWLYIIHTNLLWLPCWQNYNSLRSTISIALLENWLNCHSAVYLRGSDIEGAPIIQGCQCGYMDIRNNGNNLKWQFTHSSHIFFQVFFKFHSKEIPSQLGSIQYEPVTEAEKESPIVRDISYTGILKKVGSNVNLLILSCYSKFVFWPRCINFFNNWKNKLYL